MAARTTVQPRKWVSEAARKRAYRALKAGLADRVVRDSEHVQHTALIDLRTSLERSHDQNVALTAEVARLRSELSRAELDTVRRGSGSLNEELRVARGLIELQRQAIEDLRAQVANL